MAQARNRVPLGPWTKPPGQLADRRAQKEASRLLSLVPKGFRSTTAVANNILFLIGVGSLGLRRAVVEREGPWSPNALIGVTQNGAE